MILPTMTIDELIREIQSDYKEVYARWKAYKHTYERQLKKVRYPWKWGTSLITKRNNTWQIIHYAFSKKDATVSFPKIFLTFRYTGGIWAAHVPEGTNMLYLFPPHFITRYNERYLEFENEGNFPQNLSIIILFFVRNRVSCMKSEIENSVRGFCEDGMLLGDWISDSVALVKTFLSRNELKINQYVEYYDYIMYLLVHDMFLSRKGYTFTCEEIDNLPDTYIDPKEWSDFLFYRRNPLLIELYKECQEFRQKNSEEYQKISGMLDIISDNRYPTESLLTEK